MNSKDQSLQYCHAVSWVMKLGNSVEVSHVVRCECDRTWNEHACWYM